MAAGWEASVPERVTALVGANVYLNRWNTQFRVRGGRFLYADYGVVGVLPPFQALLGGAIRLL